MTAKQIEREFVILIDKAAAAASPTFQYLKLTVVREWKGIHLTKIELKFIPWKKRVFCLCITIEDVIKTYII